MPPPAGPFISFLSDFGGGSTAAVCRGVMWSITPDARLLDLTHDVRPFAIRDGAFLLSRAVAYLPVGVHLAVVDPGVGTARRPVVVRAARGDLLVGPDNGLLLPAARELGGATAAWEITNRDLWLPQVSSTFHGRDLFAPVAAHLAGGTDPSLVGPTVDVDSLVDLRLPEARSRDGGLDTGVLVIDRFGNARLAGQPADLEAVAGPLSPGRPFRVSIGERQHHVTWHATFGEVEPGAALLYEDADYGGLGIGVNRGSAAERFGLETDTPVRIEPA
jgi:S-adenosyl-L-methionine hydrolase (adenosine-forming)